MMEVVTAQPTPPTVATETVLQVPPTVPDPTPTEIVLSIDNKWVILVIDFVIFSERGIVNCALKVNRFDLFYASKSIDLTLTF
jgi:hypothetical protein